MRAHWYVRSAGPDGQFNNDDDLGRDLAGFLVVQAAQAASASTSNKIAITPTALRITGKIVDAAGGAIGAAAIRDR